MSECYNETNEGSPLLFADDFDFGLDHRGEQGAGVPSWDIDLSLRMQQLDDVLVNRKSTDPLDSPMPTTSLKIKPFRCDECHEAFHRTRELDQHRREVHKHQVGTAATTSTTTPQSKLPAPSALKRPSTGTEGEAPRPKPFKCPLCDMRFHSGGARNSHKRKVHLRAHLCTLCDMAFGSAQKLERHMKTHTGIKEFKCETCGKEFMTHENLVQHYKLHLGMNDYVCNICDRRYYSKSGLQHHQKQNHNVGTFDCPDCSEKFATKYELVLHRKSHRGNLPEKCSVCSNRFATAVELKQHRITCHTNRPYACPKCPHRSKTEDKLARHLISHTSKDEQRCPHCDNTFVFKNSLKKHLKGRCQVLKQKQFESQTTIQQRMQQREEQERSLSTLSKTHKHVPIANNLTS